MLRHSSLIGIDSTMGLQRDEDLSQGLTEMRALVFSLRMTKRVGM
jgi:hypothetical protein